MSGPSLFSNLVKTFEGNKKLPDGMSPGSLSMKNTFLIAIIILATNSVSAISCTKSESSNTTSNSTLFVEPCESSTNRWTLTVNHDNQATKEDLLETFYVLSEGYFKIDYIARVPYSQLSVSFITSFHSNIFPEPSEAEWIRKDILTRVTAIPGNRISCPIQEDIVD